MRFQAKLYKDGEWWLAEVPIFAAMTQGRTRKEALAMIVDWFETIITRPECSVTVHEGKRGEFEIRASDTKAMVCLLLQRQRQVSGLSLAGAAEPGGPLGRIIRTPRSAGQATPTRRFLPKEPLNHAAIDSNRLSIHQVLRSPSHVAQPPPSAVICTSHL